MFYNVPKHLLTELSEILDLGFVPYEGTAIEDFDGDATITRVSVNDGNILTVKEVGTSAELYEILEEAKETNDEN